MDRRRPKITRLAVVAVALISLSVFAADMGLRLFSPSDNTHLRVAYPWQEDGVVVSPIRKQPGGLQEGDVLLTIDGRSMEDWVQSLFNFSAERPEWKVGQVIEYQVKRSGEMLNVPVTLIRYPIVDVAGNVWGIIITVLGIFIIAGFIFIKRSFDPAAQVLLIASTAVLGGLTWSFGMDVLSIVNGTGFWLNIMLTRIFGVVGWVAFIHFALVFPKSQPFIRSRRWFLPLLYALPLLLMVTLGILTWGQTSSVLDWIAGLDERFAPLELVFVFAFLVAIIWSFLTARDPISRHQARWVSYAFIVTAFLYIVLMLVPDLFVGSPLVDYNAIGPIGLLIPISIALAIFRYRLFDIDLIINRTLVYGALTAGVIGLYVLIVAAVGGVLQTSNNLVGLLLATLVAALLIKPLHNLLQRKADRLVPVSTQMPLESSNNDSMQSEKSSIKQMKTAVNYDAPNSMPASVPEHISLPIRLAWYLALVVAVGIFIASIPGFWPIYTKGFIDPRFVYNPSPLVLVLNIMSGLASSAAVLLCLILAFLLFHRQPRDRMALFLSFYLLAFSVFSGPLQMLGPILPGRIISLAWFAIIPLIMFPATCFLFLLFPDGRFATDWSRWLALASLITAPLMAIANFIWSRGYLFPLAAGVIGSLLPFIVMMSVVYAQFVRYRHIASRQQRQQIKWVAYGLGIFLFIQFFSAIQYFWSFSLPAGTPFPIWRALSFMVSSLSMIIIPLSFTIAVMRYKLYDIDVIINRTLVFGSLSLLIAGLYILIVGGLGTLFQTQSNFLIALLATGLVAVVFQPLRARLQRGVNRLVYGERDDPLAALSKLGQKLETTVVPEELLPILVRTVADTLKLHYVAISLRENGSLITVAEHGKLVLEINTLPLVYQGERVGQLVIALRSPDEDFSPAEMELLSNIARQAGAAAHAVRLTADLRRSRENLVTAREEERRRLRRDLHDGLGPTLAGQTLKLDAALDLVDENPEALRSLLLDLKSQSQSTVTRIRRLVYDLRPPSLDDLGLTGAMQAHIYQLDNVSNGLNISLETPTGKLPPLTAAVEVAAYRIAQEALTNVVRHAQAKECRLRLSYKEGRNCLLLLEIEDDGIGLKNHQQPGIGLSSMRERAAELGGMCQIETAPEGGTRVTASLPIRREGSP